MTKKSASKVVTLENTKPAEKPAVGGALAALLAISEQKPTATSGVELPALADPAIAGASMKKGSKSVAILGIDSSITKKARRATRLKKALESAAATFATYQSDLRDYGASKRGLYNSTFGANVTTVSVPFTRKEQNGDVVEDVVSYVQVVCQNKYSVQKDMILANKTKFGDHFDRLFKVDTKKILKPGAEDLIKNVLTEAGLTAEAAEAAMGSLMDVETSVTTTETYESASKLVKEEELTAILGQSVSRVSPSLRFS